ncbi:MAG TPA: LpqB family beta-propeller domain-containing protein [Actinomycetes bacterium]|nr:LpqB family beta-propeller domain-containing protein [Actinomycetes bacterium]
MPDHRRVSARLVRVAAVVAALCVTATACAEIPTSGPIEEGVAVQAAVEEPFIRVLPRPPQAGLGPDEIVASFLAASASFEDDHAVARLYLAPEAAATWDAGAGVTVYGADAGVDFVADGSTVIVRTQAEATIDAAGLLQPRRVLPVRRRFELTQVAGEWRISRLAPGLLLSRSDVDRSFRSFDLFFLTPEGDRLVPDPVFIPIARPGAATSLARALLDGATPWLAPAVRTAFPPDTTTVVDAVPVENGVAVVDLTAEALGATDADRERMAAQLVWTLDQLSEVTAVRITVEGLPLQLPAAPLDQTTATWAAYDPNVTPTGEAGYLVVDGAMNEYAALTPEPVPGVLGSGSVTVADPTATLAGDVFAAVTGDRRQVVVQGRFAPEDVATVASGSDFAGPSFDQYGRLWLADRVGSGTVLHVREEGGRTRRVSAPELRRSTVVALRVASDGTRAAVIVTQPDGSGALFLARVVRVDDRSLKIEGLRRLGRQFVDVADVAWAESDGLAVLGQVSGSVMQPFLVSVDGDLVQAGGTLQGIVGLAAAPERPLLAATEDGRVWQDTPLGWRLVSRGRDPGYPG